MTIVAPVMTPTQAAAWHALFAVHQRLPTGWCLVGGQMVHSLCWEHGITSSRPTEDADAALDVRAHPRMLYDFTSSLADLGYGPDGESWTGHHHRWVNGRAQIDVLIPRFLGVRADSRRGASGGTTIASAGAQGALNRAEPIQVEVAGVVGTVLRPTLQGALFAKAAALVNDDPNPDRHLLDSALLGTAVGRTVRLGKGATAVERRRLLSALARLDRRPALTAGLERGPGVTRRVRLALDRT